MKTIGLLLAALVTLSGQTPAASTAGVRHLVYQFGYNTKAASQGAGTGTTTVDILGPAKDGGVMMNGTDFWWNTVRPRATNSCEVYPNGTVACMQRPYGISPMQLSLFPLLAQGYFKGLGAAATSSWKHTYQVKAAIVPGASAMAGNQYTWDCVTNLQGKGPIPKGDGSILIQSTGTMAQQGGHYRAVTAKTTIAYSPVAKVPVLIRDVRTHLPQSSVYNNDLIELQILKDSAGGH